MKAVGNDDLDVADTKYNLATLIKGQVRNLYRKCPSSEWCRAEAPRPNVYWDALLKSEPAGVFLVWTVLAFTCHWPLGDD